MYTLVFTLIYLSNKYRQLQSLITDTILHQSIFIRWCQNSRYRAGRHAEHSRMCLYSVRALIAERFTFHSRVFNVERDSAVSFSTHKTKVLNAPT